MRFFLRCFNILCYASGFYMLLFVVRCLWCARARVCVIHWHCSVQLSMFNMGKRCRNKIIIIIIIIIKGPWTLVTMIRSWNPHWMVHFIWVFAEDGIIVLRKPHICSAPSLSSNSKWVALKGAIQDLFTISSLRGELPPARMLKWPGRSRVQITCNTLGADHMQHVVCKSRATRRALITCNVSCATWYEGTAQLLSLAELKSHYFSFVLLAETINH